jgi:hypothetical protein
MCPEINSENQTEKQRNFSGRFPVRMPKYLHRRLTEVSREQGVSLNQFICTAAAMVAGLNSEMIDPPRAPGSNRISDEEFSRIWNSAIG